MEKTYARIAENYFWPGMYSETLKYVKEYDTCLRTKPKVNNQVGLLGKRIIEQPWTVVAADTMDPLPRSKAKNQYILVCVDMFTKWVEIIPVKNKVAATIEKEFHKKIISKWGIPRIFFYRQRQRIRKRNHGKINAKLRNTTFENATIPPTIKPNRKM